MHDFARQNILSRAFDLARFLRPRRAVALEITRRAVAALDTAVAIQDKRLYYRPRGGTGRSKVFLAESHLLQRLVCAEAERFGEASCQQELTVGFVAALVRRAVERNSFYTALAVSRILHDYTTREGVDLHATVVGDRTQVRPEDYWRARKQQLMGELRQLYGDRVEMVRGPHGEDRFASVEDASPLRPLVEEALTRLTPWDTPCAVTESSDVARDGLPSLRWRGDEAEDAREVERMHALLHPSCFGRLTRALGMDPPALRLAIPRFLAVTAGGGDEDRGSSRPLSPKESEQLASELRELAQKRRTASVESLRVLVDGVLSAHIQPSPTGSCTVPIGPEAARVELVAMDSRGENPVLLAWLPLERLPLADAFRPLVRTLTVEGGQRITFTVRPLDAARTGEAAPGADVIVHYQETSRLRSLASILRRLGWNAGGVSGWRAARPVLGSLAVVAVAGALVHQAWIRRSGSPRATAEPAAESSGPTAREPAGPAAISAKESAGPHTPPATEGTTRSLKGRPEGVPLDSVTAVWVDAPALAGDPRALARQVEEALTAAGIAVATDRERAEAALHIDLAGGGAGIGQDPRLRLRVQLLDASGAVLWPSPAVPRVYDGPLSRAIPRLAGDLGDALRAARAAPHSPRPDRR